MQNFYIVFNKIFLIFYNRISTNHSPTLKARCRIFNAVVINKGFLLNLEKKIGANSSCRFRE